MKKKKLTPIEMLIRISDKCMSLNPRIKPDGTLKEYPCNCRENVKKILKKYYGVKA